MTIANTANPRDTWARVTRREPCPVCDHGSWCLRSRDGLAVICGRKESANRRGAAGWLHRLGEPVRDSAPPLPIKPAGVPRAADADLDPVYRAMLGLLFLSQAHRDHLLGRGLTAADLDRAAYRSLPASCRAGIARRLRERFGDRLLLTVPGLVVRDGPHGSYMTVAGRAGIIIPARNTAGQIVGLITRPDVPGEDGGKYLWVSSVASGGPSPSARVHVPAGVRPDRRIVLTEGVLKADVAHTLSGRPIIGMPNPFVGIEAIATLRALGAEEALLALDADAATNPHIANAQLDGLRRLKAAGFTEGLIKWNPELGKGIDDALLETRRRRQR